MLFTRTMVTDLVGMCLDEHVQVMSGKACQKRKDIMHAIMHLVRSEDLTNKCKM